MNKKRIVLSEIILEIVCAALLLLLFQNFLVENFILKLIIISIMLIMFRVTFFQLDVLDLNYFFDDIAKLLKFKYNSKALDKKEKECFEKIENYVETTQKKLLEIQANNNAIKKVLDINNRILEYGGMEDLYDYLLEKAVESIDKATHGSLMKLDENYDLEIIALYGFNKEQLLGTKLDMFDSFLWNETNGLFDKAVVVDNIKEFNEKHLSERQLEIFENNISFVATSSISAPINIDGELYGTINVDTAAIGAFGEEEKKILEFYGNQVAAVIKKKIVLDNKLYISRYDALTNIYNRGYFTVIINDYLKRARRFNEKFALIKISLNNLEVIEGLYGNFVKEDILKSFVFLIKKNIREIDIFSRLEEKEFTLVMLETDLEQADSKLKNIKKQFKEINNRKEWELICNYGISLYPLDGENLNDLLREADKKLFIQKV